MSAESSFCPSCYAEAGAPCAWDCTGLASQVEQCESSLTANLDAPGAKRPAERSDVGAEVTDAHCLVCHAAALQDRRHAEGLIGRWMTVQASKDYARIYFRHELDASQGRVAPGEERSDSQ